MNHKDIIIGVTFIIYAIFIIMIGFYANRQTQNLSDYILGGRHLSGPIVALGAGASDMSSWLLMALPGAVFIHGLNHIWLPIGLSIGAYCNWKFVAARLRVYTEKAGDALTLPAYFSGRFPRHSKILRAVTAIIILTFFAVYTSAGFVAFSYLLSLLFPINHSIALLLSASIIILYTAIGGFLAISWLDFFQGSLMFMSLLIVPTFTFHHLHTWQHALLPIWQSVPHFFNPFHDISIIAVASLLAWGLGYFGQPHILVRFMAARSHRNIPIARYICMFWMTIALAGAVITAIVGRGFFGHSGLNNPENVFTKLAYLLFNPWLAGILLSAVLSAIMSTSSAQLLASSSALIEDLYHPFIHKNATKKQLMWGARIAVLMISCVSYYLATDPKNNILQLVSYAWSGLGASFGPIILISLYWKQMTAKATIVGMITGAATVIIWEILSSHIGGIFYLYSIIPGFLTNCIAIFIFSRFGPKPTSEMINTFNEVQNTF